MEKRGEEIHASETEASGGSKEGVVRWVLLIGLVLAIGFLTLIWVTGAAVQDDGPDSETSVSNTMASEQAESDARGEPITPPMEGEASPAPATAPSETPAT